MVTNRLLVAGGDDALVRRVAAAASAGVHLVQVRERDLEGRALLRLAASCVDAVRGTRTRIVVNDRLDVALAAGAHGVHLRADSIGASRARRIVPPGFLIGRSVHGAGDARLAAGEGGLDYLVFGTLFPTASKADVSAAGPQALAEVVAAVGLPVLAIGGITPGTAPTVAAAGAAGVAAIGLFAEGGEERVREAARALAAAFDTPRRVP